MNLDDTDFNNTYNNAGSALDAFDIDTATAKLAANADPFYGVMMSVNEDLFGFADTWTATLEALDHASSDIATVQTELNAIAKTYTATITVDTSRVPPAVQAVADQLPSSPAKTGPLSKEPSFDYVVDAFVAAMDQIEQQGSRRAFDLAPTVRASIAGGALAVPLAAGRAATVRRRRVVLRGRPDVRGAEVR